MTDAAQRVYWRLVILRCQGGDEAALAELIERYSPGLRLFLRKMCAGSGATAEADDLLQETWFEVYRKVNGLRRPEAFAAWVYRIARDKAYAVLRRRGRPAQAQMDELSEATDGSDNAFSAEDAQAVRAALEEIPVELREVLMLRFLEEMDYQQIAQVIGRPVGTVRSRLHHAKAVLRSKLTVFEHAVKGKTS